MMGRIWLKLRRKKDPLAFLHDKKEATEKYLMEISSK
jgi:hypothetical protein